MTPNHGLQDPYVMLYHTIIMIPYNTIPYVNIPYDTLLGFLRLWSLGDYRDWLGGLSLPHEGGASFEMAGTVGESFHKRSTVLCFIHISTCIYIYICIYACICSHVAIYVYVYTVRVHI